MKLRRCSYAALSCASNAAYEGASQAFVCAVATPPNSAVIARVCLEHCYSVEHCGAETWIIPTHIYDSHGGTIFTLNFFSAAFLFKPPGGSSNN